MRSLTHWISGIRNARDTAKVAAFDAALSQNTASFAKAFPDYVPTVPFALVHSLGEMDGGGRTLKGKDGTKQDWLVFGADVMARVLHPKAGLPELLLNIPPEMVSGTEAKRREAFAQLGGVLDSTEEKVLGGLFMSDDDGSGLPPRRGSYLGLLVAREIGKGRTLAELAHMPMSEAGPLIRAEIARQARQRQGRWKWRRERS